MIAIITYPGEKSTNNVIDWLNYYSCKFIRIHLQNEDFRNIELQLTNTYQNLKLNLTDGSILDFDEISCFFIRGIEFSRPKIKNDTVLPENIFNQYIDYEFITLVNYFYSKVNKDAIGWLNHNCLNKLLQIEFAIEVGLSISETLITNSKNSVLDKFNKRNIITKAIQENIAINTNDQLFVQRVQKVEKDDLGYKFFPSLFQEAIDKKLEIRTFYLDEKCYSIAIISENDNGNSVDMRDHYHTNIFEPFKLPIKVENKIIKLMNKLNLVSGSIDLIKGIDGDFYLLEVNPVGQYDWVSVYGGYNLDKKIASYLFNKETIFLNEKK